MASGVFVLLPEGHGLFLYGLCFNALALDGPEGLGLNALASGPPTSKEFLEIFCTLFTLKKPLLGTFIFLCLIPSAHDFPVFGTPDRCF